MCAGGQDIGPRGRHAPGALQLSARFRSARTWHVSLNQRMSGMMRTPFAPRPTCRKASGGVIRFTTMPVEPTIKRAVVFVDGQNLFHAAREAFGYTYPNYDIVALGRAICGAQSWTPGEIRFYTGIPDRNDDARWHQFWTAKLAVMGRQGVRVFARTLRYRNWTVLLLYGTEHTFLAGEEKGIDVRIALDIIGMAHRRECDVAVILSQDQDLSEVAEEIRIIARE
jgi:uncharacterized LabA/DUF88 family protein